jgi:putative ABC transport system permease protein
MVGGFQVALLVMIFRKMIKNKWLVSSMFLGILMTVGLVSMMPIYSEGILSRMLVKDLETFQVEKGIYPGTNYSKMEFSTESLERKLSIIEETDAYMEIQAATQFGIPVMEFVKERRTNPFSFVPAAGIENVKKVKPIGRISAYTDLYDHINLQDGRLPANQPINGVYEVLVTEQALNQFKTVLGTEFVIMDSKVKETIKIKPVGIIEKKEDNDPYFRSTDLSDWSNSFLMDMALFEQEITYGDKIPLGSSGWFFVLDYSKLEQRNIEHFLTVSKDIESFIRQHVAAFQTAFSVPAKVTIEKYFERAKVLNKFMWSLNVPVLIMLGFYMFMVSNLIIDRQKNEIAVLRSRGAARWQILSSFAVEGLILCGFALALGPFIGLGLTKVLGASNGFLEFVQRTSMPVNVSAKAYLYGAIAAAICFVMMLIPVLLATSVSIVGRKQEMARSHKTPLWHKSFLDVLTLALSLYGLYMFRTRMSDMQKLGLSSDDLNVDPLQFVFPALFVIGTGLLLLRVYPFLLRLIYWLGRKWWSPSFYSTLIQVGRSNSQYQFLMIFLIMTIAIGVFSASAARTINTNTEDRIRYVSGADFILKTEWPNDAPPANSSNGSVNGDLMAIAPQVINYSEPSFDPYTELPGVEQAAKVFVKKDATFTFDNKGGTVTLFGIDTDDFGNSIWFPDYLSHYHINDYLNLIAGDTRAVLISKTLADQRDVKVGDTIHVGWQEVQAHPFIVYGIIDYFPTFNPNPTMAASALSESAKPMAPMLIVGHLSQIQFQLQLLPYDVWLKMKPDASTNELYQGITDNKLKVTSVSNTREQLIKAKNDPFILALNGILSLGFIVSILVSFIGFLLYWILSLKGRTLQNGIMRAIGLSLRQLIGMLALEQLLTSGIAIIIGIFVGQLTSKLYVQNFQMAFSPSSLVLPFKVTFEQADFIKLYMIVIVMLTLGLLILSYMLSRTRVDQALKLGED